MADMKEHGNACCCGHGHGKEHGHEDHEHGCGCCHEHVHEHGHEHGCSCCHEHGHEHEHGEGSLKTLIVRLCVAAALLAAAIFIPAEGILKLALHALPYIVIGWDVLYRAAKNIVGGHVFDECFLMTVASLGAFCVGEYAEGVAVMLLYQLGELFQDIAADRTRDAISALTDVRPDSANVETEAGVIEMDAREVKPGAIIVVKPGERVPLDGVVLEGQTELDQSALTGESLPRGVAAGDRALSGCVNLRGLIRMRVEKGYGDSEAARILKLVEDASGRKARSEQFITRFARVYTPIVCALAVLIALIPPVFAGNMSEWVHRALIFLVVSCPCALVISVPLTFFAGIGALSRRGVLIKGGCYMDQLACADVFVFDKTGTLTEGRFRVKEVCARIEREELMELAAHAEAFSDHPLARAVLEEYGKEPDTTRTSGVEELAGRGVRALVDGRRVLVGNLKLMTENGIAAHAPAGQLLNAACGRRICGRNNAGGHAEGHCEAGSGGLEGAGRAAAGDANRRRGGLRGGGGAGRRHNRIPRRTFARRQVGIYRRAYRGARKGPGAGVCGRRHKRRSVAGAGGRGHSHGRHGLRCGDRGCGRGAYGRRAPQAGDGG